jgi:hypothetical protein
VIAPGGGALESVLQQAGRFLDRILDALSKHRRERRDLLKKTVDLELLVEKLSRRPPPERLAYSGSPLSYHTQRAQSWEMSANTVASEAIADRDPVVQRLGGELRDLVSPFFDTVEQQREPRLKQGQRHPDEVLKDLRRRLQYVRIPRLAWRRTPNLPPLVDNDKS